MYEQFNCRKQYFLTEILYALSYHVHTREVNFYENQKERGNTHLVTRFRESDADLRDIP